MSSQFLNKFKGRTSKISKSGIDHLFQASLKGKIAHKSTKRYTQWSSMTLSEQKTKLIQKNKRPQTQQQNNGPINQLYTNCKLNYSRTNQFVQQRQLLIQKDKNTRIVDHDILSLEKSTLKLPKIIKIGFSKRQENINKMKNTRTSKLNYNNYGNKQNQTEYFNKLDDQLQSTYNRHQQNTQKSYKKSSFELSNYQFKNKNGFSFHY